MHRAGAATSSQWLIHTGVLGSRATAHEALRIDLLERLGEHDRWTMDRIQAFRRELPQRQLLTFQYDRQAPAPEAWSALSPELWVEA